MAGLQVRGSTAVVCVDADDEGVDDDGEDDDGADDDSVDDDGVMTIVQGDQDVDDDSAG